MMIAFFLLSATLWALACATTLEHAFFLTNEYIQPDGFNRSSVLVNGIFPGPPIMAKKGDDLDILVLNELTDKTMAQGTSIHWHGIHMTHSVAQDGVNWVTQCPIAPGDQYRYKFSLGNQTGTYWYHSHVTTQYCDGLRGPLIIYDDNDRHRHLYDVDDASTIITLGDWNHPVSPAAFALFAPPDSVVINGRGRYEGGPKSELAVINVVKGLRYRFRVINMGCLAAFKFSVDHHALTVIEVDGHPVKAHKTNTIPIYTGQRVSVVMTADQPIDNYWMRSKSVSRGQLATMRILPARADDLHSAILRYKGAPKREPKTNHLPGYVLQEPELVPLTQIIPKTPAYRKPDFELNLNISIDDAGFFTINNRTFYPPTVPVLLQMMHGADPYKLMPRGNVIALPRNKLIEISIVGGSPLSPHPFHLHGHAFEVVRGAGMDTYNYDTPLVRDVVSTGVFGDNVTFRFITDNPGPWFLHCHVDMHLEDGMAIVLAEEPGNSTEFSEANAPEGWNNLCPKWESLQSGKQFIISNWQEG